MMLKPKVLAVDFDGVIHDYSHPIKGRRMGGVMPGAREALQQLSDSGYTILVHSVKANTSGGVEMIAKWLDYYDVRGQVWDSPGKPNADYYIDDRAIKHVDWATTMKEIK